MKTKLLYTLAFALIVTLAATGCRHKPGYLTKLPSGPTPPTVPEQAPTTIPYVPPYTTEGSPTSIPQTPGDDTAMYGMIPDRAALAAYTVHFAYDSSVIRKGEQASLQSVAQQL